MDNYFGAINDSTLLATLGQYETSFNVITDATLLLAIALFYIDYFQDFDNFSLVNGIQRYNIRLCLLLSHLVNRNLWVS
jgi:hypothetical protein